MRLFCVCLSNGRDAAQAAPQHTSDAPAEVSRLPSSDANAISDNPTASPGPSSPSGDSSSVAVSKEPPAVRRAHLGEPPERDADADIDFAEIAARRVLAIGEDAPDAEPQAE